MSDIDTLPGVTLREIADPDAEKKSDLEHKMESCPVKPLGCINGNYYFLSPSGEMRIMKWRDFSMNALVSLFDGKIGWLIGNYPAEGGRNRYRDSFDHQTASNDLIRACDNEGIFDVNMPVRGVGVWRGDYNDYLGLSSLIVHCGDVLYINGQKERAGQRIGNQIFTAAPRIPHIADRSATDAEAAQVLEFLRGWNYDRPDIDPIILTGFIGQAMLGGAPAWRAHVMVNGMAGSGKSWLVDAMRTILGGAAHDATNNYTEAGIRQGLTNEARCLLLDESEPDQSGRVKAVVEMLRHMSGGEGAKTLRGSSGGVAQRYNVTGCAYLSAILHVPLQPQDRSRITCLKLNPLEQMKTRSIHEVQDGMREMKRLSPFLRRRMIDNWGNFLVAFEDYRNAFMQAGLVTRGADQLGVIFAAKEIILHGENPCSDQISVDVDLCEHLIADMKENTKDNEGQQCLIHMLSSITDVHRDGARRTLGQLIDDARDVGTKTCSEVRALASYGLRFEPTVYSPYSPECIYIANNSQGLERIFYNTRWAGGAWIQAFEFLGAKPAGVMRIGGPSVRAHIMPMDLFTGTGHA